MTFARPAEPPAALADRSSFIAFFRESAALAQVELRKLFRDPTELFTRAVQPLLWLVIFGQVFSKVRGIPTGQVSYLAFMTPGILAQSVLFAAIFYGIAVIWERDLGVVHKLLVSPAHRASLVVGKAISAGFRGVVQSFIIYLIAFAMRIPINWNPLAILGVLFAVALGSAVFSTFSLVIACIVKSRERFMGIGQVLTMPLFFASSAIYPIAMMPHWLQIFAVLNPLTYLVDSLRGIMIRGGQSLHPFAADLAVMALIFVILAAIAAKLYPTLVR
ncbi:MAG TPA: ABC transporter permease [Candidatus Sulfotelmatobacter sp.]|nr:ABC transporter permease [Candidatus Sulfotelmatobacter sp.]